MKIKDYILVIVLLIIAFLLGGFLNTFKPPKVETIIERDTTYMRVHVRDTIFLAETRFFSKIDTVLVYVEGEKVLVPTELKFERKTYATENYSLDITGYKPELERIELFPIRETIHERVTQTITKTPTWQAGLVVGTQYGINEWNSYLGARARVNWKLLNAEATLGYSPSKNGVIGEVRLGMDLWQK